MEGPVYKRDVMQAGIMLEKAKEYAIMVSRIPNRTTSMSCLLTFYPAMFRCQGRQGCPNVCRRSWGEDIPSRHNIPFI